MRRTIPPLLLGLLCLLGAGPAKPVPKPLQWLTAYGLATTQAHKQNKLILAYFSGSDWDPWCRKLNDEVLDSDMFRDWANQYVIPLQVDYPREKHQSAIIKEQNDKLKLKYGVALTPTFLFLDPDGDIIARAGYDDAYLRDDEQKGEPISWIKFANSIVMNRPKDETLAEQPNLSSALEYAAKHFKMMLLMVSQGTFPVIERQKEQLLKNQPFIRFVNRNFVFARVQWPDDTDKSDQANVFRVFADKNKVKPAPLQFVVWDNQLNKVKVRIAAFSPDNIDPLLDRLDAQLPRMDYNGEWLESLPVAKEASKQTKKPLMLCFTSMDSSDWCQKFDAEVFQTDDFKAFARKNLVLMRVDFPKNGEQNEAIKAQNKVLAEMYAVRGYPTMIVLNTLGQKIGESKYMKGGPGPFLAELDGVLKKDAERRAPPE